MPEAIEVRKVPIHSVSDASELARLIDDGVLEASRIATGCAWCNSRRATAPPSNSATAIPALKPP